MAIRTVGVISKPRKKELQDILPTLVPWLRERSVNVVLDRETASSVSAELRAAMGTPVLARSELGTQCDLVLVLGGDGTLLAAARNLQGRDVPILAVNLGSLGFLTGVTVAEIYANLELILNDKHQLESRKMLKINVSRGGEPGTTYHALNDAVLNKGAISRILDFETYVDGQFVNLFNADGLIVSTPTGSTAYCLAAGGPIVHPSVEAFIIVPICSHTLTNRPLVVSDRSKIAVVLKTEAESVFLTVDGQVGLAMHSGDRILCELSPNRISLVRPPQKEFYEVLRNKLKWGER